MKFYSSIAPFYEDIFPLNLAQVKFINEALNNSTSVKILDVGCGVGTLINELDKTYKSLYGIDLDAEMIDLAKQRTYANNPAIQAGNMLEIDKSFHKKQFDAIICFGNTLVHLPEESDIKTFIKQAYNCLQEGGKLLLQIINYDRILEKGINELPTINNEVVTFIRKYDYLKTEHKINFKTKLIIKENAQNIDNEQLLVPIKSAELVSLLKEVGFEKVNSFGGFNRSRLTIDSIPLVIEAIR